MSVDINKKRRRIDDEEEEKQKLHHLSITLSVNNKHRKKKRRRISAEEKGTYTQQYLSSMFPHDIMLDILSRLPVKPLMRFRSVSKSWNYLIRKDQSFINMHLSHYKLLQHEKMILIDRDFNFRLYSFDYNKGLLERLIHHNSRIRHIHRDKNYIWGSCNGLICTGSTSELDLFISNPSTTEYRKILCPNFIGDVDCSYDFCYGFGYNPNENDYVVVKLISCQVFLSTVAIYSLRNNSWKKIQDIPYVVEDMYRPGVFYGSSLYWVVHSKFINPENLHRHELDSKDNKILAFEITTENFVEVPCPGGQHGSMIVGQYQGKLCVYHDKRIGEFSFDLWVMNEYKVRESWSKVFNIRKSDLKFFCFSSGIYGSTREGYILIYVQHGLLLYDPKQKTRRRILGVDTFGSVNYYVPSIVTLDFN